MRVTRLEGQVLQSRICSLHYGCLIARPDPDPLTYRLITDHLGSPRLVVNAATGAVVQRMDYDAWGNVLLDDNPEFQPFGFAGGVYDRDTRLVRFGARNYEAGVGRWSSKDTEISGSSGLNQYAYAFGGSVNWRDWNGKAPASGLIPPGYTGGNFGLEWADAAFGGPPDPEDPKWWIKEALKRAKEAADRIRQFLLDAKEREGNCQHDEDGHQEIREQISPSLTWPHRVSRSTEP